jgi:hypothetical protein
MSSMLGSPRRPTISTPTNPMHVTHVSIDNQTGEFTVRGLPLRYVPACACACACYCYATASWLLSSLIPIPPPPPPPYPAMTLSAPDSTR